MSHHTLPRLRVYCTTRVASCRPVTHTWHDRHQVYWSQMPFRRHALAATRVRTTACIRQAVVSAVNVFSACCVCAVCLLCVRRS